MIMRARFPCTVVFLSCHISAGVGNQKHTQAAIFTVDCVWLILFSVRELQKACL